MVQKLQGLNIYDFSHFCICHSHLFTLFTKFKVQDPLSKLQLYWLYTLIIAHWK